MSAATHLASFGVTVDQAREFIFANYDANHPDVILEIAVQYGVTNEMLAQIVDVGYTTDQVRDYFISNGLAGAELDAQPLLSDNVSPLADLIAVDPYLEGVLSIGSLRAGVQAQTGEAAYNAIFDPNQYEGSADGEFSDAELGGTGLGPLPATIETVESLFYGTLINALNAIDESEDLELEVFLEENEPALLLGDLAVMEQFVSLVVTVFQDPAPTPIYSEDQIAETIVEATVVTIGLVRDGSDLALFDGLLFGPLG